MSTTVDAGLDAVTDGPSEGSAGTGAPQICVVGSANCETQVPDCEAHIADAPACFPTYLGTTRLGISIAVLAIAVADDGAVYLGGIFAGSADVDPGPGTDIRTAVGNQDGFVTKLNPDGSRAWIVTLGGTSAAGGSTVGIGSMSLSSTSLTVVGNSSGIVDFDPGPGVEEHDTGFGGFILKLTLDGALSWVGTLNSGSFCYPSALKENASGDLYIVGLFGGPCDLDPGPGVEQRGLFPGTVASYVMKVSSQAVLRWVHTYEGYACTTDLHGVAVTRDGNAWVTGMTAGTCLLDGEVGRPLPGGGALVAAFDPSGSPSFTWTLGHPSIAAGEAVEAGADGSVFLGGRIWETVDFDPGPGVVLGSPSNSSRPVPRTDRVSAGYVLNLTAAGAFRSVYTMAGIDVTALNAPPDGGVLMMGIPWITERSVGGVFLTKLNADLTPGWSLYACGPGCVGTALATGPGTFLVGGGNNGGTVDIDPGPAEDLIPTGSFLSRYAF